jgi:flavoprotein
VLPPPDAIVVAPATFNTINKWAAGISDTLVLGLLTEAIGKRLPVVALPFVNAARPSIRPFRAASTGCEPPACSSCTAPTC